LANAHAVHTKSRRQFFNVSLKALHSANKDEDVGTTDKQPLKRAQDGKTIVITIIGGRATEFETLYE
jgi:hypothetical protein